MRTSVLLVQLYKSGSANFSRNFIFGTRIGTILNVSATCSGESACGFSITEMSYGADIPETCFEIGPDATLSALVTPPPRPSHPARRVTTYIRNILLLWLYGPAIILLSGSIIINTHTTPTAKR